MGFSVLKPLMAKCHPRTTWTLVSRQEANQEIDADTHALSASPRWDTPETI